MRSYVDILNHSKYLSQCFSLHHSAFVKVKSVNVSIKFGGWRYDNKLPVLTWRQRLQSVENLWVYFPFLWWSKAQTCERTAELYTQMWGEAIKSWREMVMAEDNSFDGYNRRRRRGGRRVGYSPIIAHVLFQFHNIFSLFPNFLMLK